MGSCLIKIYFGKRHKYDYFRVIGGPIIIFLELIAWLLF